VNASKTVNQRSAVFFALVFSIVAGRVITVAYCITAAKKPFARAESAIFTCRKTRRKIWVDFDPKIQGFRGFFRRQKISKNFGIFFGRNCRRSKVKVFKTIVSALS
jgi:hypothetical protein